MYENGVKCNNALISSTYSGWIDLFGWGTNGHNNIYPYTNTQNESDYGVANGSRNIASYEWGMKPIENGGNADDPDLWRTLTSAEWGHLLNTRTVNGGSGNGYSYSYVMINNVSGLLLYNDDFYSQTVYNNRTDLTEVPEGCVFLPGAGRRTPPPAIGTATISEVGNVYYWTSSVYRNNSRQPYMLQASASSTASVPVADHIYYGHSVRLVQNAQ